MDANAESLFKEKVNHVLALKNSDKNIEAIKELKKLLEEYPEKAVLYGLMGGLYSHQDDYEFAIKYYEKLLELNPKSEAGSTGLFHALNETNRGDEALEEMKRYLSTYGSKKDNYKWILQDLVDGIEEPILQPYREFILEQASKYNISASGTAN